MASINKRDGKPKPWIVHWRERGRQRSKSFLLKTQAESFHREVDLVEATGRVWVDPRNNPNRRTVATAADGWLATRTVAPSTTARDRSYVASHIVRSSISGIVTDELAPSHVRQWIVELTDRGLAASTIAKSRQILHSILDVEIDDGRIDRNPVDKIPAPRVTAGGAGHALSGEQIAVLVEAIDDRYRAMVVGAYAAGLRFGEVAGLRRSRINLRSREITIDANLRRDGTLGPPKTSESAATLYVAESVIDEIRSHLRRYPVDGPDGLVFRTPRGHAIRYPNFRRVPHGPWARAVAGAGLAGVTFHDLRRSTATSLYDAGVDVKTASAMMRHRSTALTLDLYTRLDRETMRTSALEAPTVSGVGRVLGGADGGNVVDFPGRGETRT